MPQSLLDLLRSLSAVDCDTMDAEFARDLGPFVDCTSNQAIVLGELIRTESQGDLKHHQMILSSIDYAKSNAAEFPGVDIVELAVDVITVKLAHRIAPYLTGYVHAQSNPRYSYDKNLVVKNAQRLVTLFGKLDPEPAVSKKLCIKILATWDGVQACRELEQQGITTLATGIVSLQQAALASWAGCTYIGSYVNELRVHFDKSFVDQDKRLSLPGVVKGMYEKNRSTTRNITASLTSVDEVMQLAGVDHITISPPLLSELANTPADGWKGNVGSAFKAEINEGAPEDCEDEGKWRLAFSREQDGEREAKLIRAINVFCKKQDELEDLVNRYL